MAAVHGFYDKIQLTTCFGPVFDSVIPAECMAVHHSGQDVRFLVERCCCAPRATLRAGCCRRTLPLPDVGEEHFRRWLTLFRATVELSPPPQVAVLFFERALRIAHSFTSPSPSIGREQHGAFIPSWP